MKQDLKKAYVIYFQFNDLIFKSLSKIEIINVIFSIIEKYNNVIFIFFINNYMKFIKIFNEMFDFLYFKYFSRITFNLIYFSNYKIYMFTNSLKIINFINNLKDLRFFIKHRERIIYKKKSINREKLNVII